VYQAGTAAATMTSVGDYCGMLVRKLLLSEVEVHMPSFDVVSRVDMQEMDNAINQVKKEISTRFDFRGSKTQVDLDRKEAKITVLTEDDMKLRAIKDMLIAKVVHRSIEAEALVFGDHEKAGGDMVRQIVTITNGIDIETARKVVKVVKEAKLKVQSAIQGEEVRITGKKRDDLQEAIQTIKEADLGMPLQFVNFRE
jgi:cyclic-di-GMP-binding protein